MRQWHTVRRAARAVWLLLYGAVFTQLTACERGPDAPFERYLKHLGSALAVATPDIRPTRAPLPPAVEALHPTLSASGIDALDFLQLSGCAVQANIIRRQTSLALSAKPSQRLLLELEYLRLVPPCISGLRDRNHHGLADTLEQARQEKLAQLPALIFNATLGSDEYRAFWLASPAPGEYPRGSPERAAAALAAINEQSHFWLHGDYRAHNRDFELLLSEVAGGNGGTQLQDWTRQIDWLATANRVVERGLARSPCTDRRRETARRIAQAHAGFGDALQPLLRQSQHRYEEITTAIAALETQLDTALPHHYRQWMEDRDQQVAMLASAPQQHLELLHRMQQACATE